MIELHFPSLPEAELSGRRFNQSESATSHLIRNKQYLKCLQPNVFTADPEVCRSKEHLRQHQVSWPAADCVVCHVKGDNREIDEPSLSLGHVIRSKLRLRLHLNINY